MIEPPSVASLWTDLVEKDDRTSPEEYPDMALIKFDEFEYLLEHYAAQRVSAETERCAQVADNEAKDYAALYVLEGFEEDLKRKDAAERIARRIRARL